MSRPTWSETPPQQGASILRDDGRVCVLDAVRMVSHSDAKKKLALAVPYIEYRMKCGEMLQSRDVSLVVYYPAQVDDAPTCLKCIA